MKPHLPKGLIAALCAVITAIANSALAGEVTEATFTTTNSPDGTLNSDYNAPGFVLTLTGSRMATASNPPDIPITGCDTWNLSPSPQISAKMRGMVLIQASPSQTAPARCSPCQQTPTTL